MKDIDWSKAPEGATHYGYTDFGDHLQFYRIPGIRGNSYDYWAKTAPVWVASFGVSIAPVVIPRPVTPQWNGEGLPPVGVVCEVMSTNASGEWLEATIVAHDGDKAVYRLYDGSYGGDPEFFEDNPARPLFRPTRTPEQIAAEEREAAVKAMVDRFALYSHPDIQWRALFAQMYDCGCRMTAEDER